MTARQHVQLQLLVNRVVRILDGSNASAATDAGNDAPRGAPSLPPSRRPVAFCKPLAPAILLLTPPSDTGLIFFAARLLLQGGGGFSGGVKGASELLNVLLQPQNHHSDKDSTANRFPSLCVLSLDLNSNIGSVDPVEAADLLLLFSASPPLNVTIASQGRAVDAGGACTSSRLFGTALFSSLHRCPLTPPRPRSTFSCLNARGMLQHRHHQRLRGQRVHSTLSLPSTAGRNRTRHLRLQRRRWCERSAFYKTFPMFLLLASGLKRKSRLTLFQPHQRVVMGPSIV